MDELRVFDLRQQQGFGDRFKYYYAICNPANALASKQTLQHAKQTVLDYRCGKLIPSSSNVSSIVNAHKLYLSAYHPDTGQLQNVIGRMSFQVPGGTVLIAAMLVFYRSNAAVVFWQTANQTFNAVVNYTNRNAKSDLDEKQIGIACTSATVTGVVVALGLKSFLSKRAGNLAQRLVPLVAVAAANAVNIPLMRQNELKTGIELVNEKEETVAKSRLAALKAVALVTVSRVCISSPAMLITPIVIENLYKRRWFVRRSGLLNIPVQTALSALGLFIMVPVGCSFFPQRNWLTTEQLKKWEPNCFHSIEHTQNEHKLYFNKGL